jgi:PEP-CTERM motif
MGFKQRRMSALWIALLSAAAMIGASGRAAAELLYASTSSPDNTIVSLNTATGSVSTLFTAVNPPPDGLLALDPTHLLYLAQGNTAVPGSGQLREYNFSTGTDTLVAGGLNRPADLTLDPGGATALVSDSSVGQITRINLSTGSITTLPMTYPIGPGGIGPNGLAYVGNNLFANIGDRFGGPTGSSVAELNPVTGAIMGQTRGLNSVDGLTYDSSSGRLFAASTLGNVLYSINPTNLADVVSIPLPGEADGVVSNQHGLLFIGGRATTDAPVYEYNEMTGALTTLISAVSGATAIDLSTAVPEPSSAVLLGLGGLCLLGLARVRQAR